MQPPQTTNAGGGYGTSGNGVDTGYVLLKRKDDGQMVTVKSPNASGNSNQAQQPQTQPQSLPTIPQAQMQYQHPINQLNRENEVDRKYFRYFICNALKQLLQYFMHYVIIPTKAIFQTHLYNINFCLNIIV